MKSKRKKKSTRSKELLNSFNYSHILQMSDEEKAALKLESDNFFDNLPDGFHTDFRLQEGIDFYNNIDKKDCHKYFMALLFL